MLEVTIWPREVFDRPALDAENDEDDNVVDYHSTQGDFGDEFVPLVDENAEIKDENGDFSEGGRSVIEKHACPANL